MGKTIALIIMIIIVIIIVTDDCPHIDTSHITFNIFKKLYDVNPDRFILYGSWVCYDTGDFGVYLLFRNPADKLRYKLFRWRIKRGEKLDQDKMLHDIMLKNLQDDINNL